MAPCHSLHVLYSVGSDPLGHKLHSSAQRRRLVVEEGLLQVHLSPHTAVSQAAPRWPPPPQTHLQFLLGPVGSRRAPELRGGGGDLADDASALGRASGHKRRQELSELTCIRMKETITLNIGVLLVPRFNPGSTHREKDNRCREAADLPKQCSPEEKKKKKLNNHPAESF